MTLDKAIRAKYKPVIGLEVHVQLQTESKIFVGDSTSFGNHPNTNIHAITLGHPGTMPKLNKKVVEYAVRLGIACNSEISKYQYFDRKNYFYPDLPKGYQITQDATPICVGGYVHVRTESGLEKNIPLTKVHMEEDAGKSIHLEGESDTLVDYNRAGVPLLEIVTDPAIDSAEEAYAFVSEIRKIVRYLEICDGNMEQGSMRCDANISIMPVGSTELGRKVEVKNMNSIRNVARAIEHEIERQILEVEKGNEIISETRTFDADKGTTAGMRTKEELNDYRYFPEPDLSPMEISEAYIEEVMSNMPALPHELFRKFTKEYKLPEYDSAFLTETRDVAHYFEAVVALNSNYKAVANWMMGPIKAYLNEEGHLISDLPITPALLSSLIDLVQSGKVNYTAAAQQIFPHLLNNPGDDPEQVAQKLNLIQDSSQDSIQPIIDDVLASFPDKVKAYRNGKKGLVGMFMGELMKRSKGKVDPKVANKLLRESLEQ